MFENAKWISGAGEPFKPSDQSFLFRKSFHVDSSVKRVDLHICALGLGVYTINGSRVTKDVLCTPFTRYDKRVIYQSYDITGLIRNGENVIGVHAGNGFYNNNMNTWNDRMAPWRDNPKLIAVIMIEKEDGKRERVLSDSTWKWVPGPCVYNHMRQGEMYDAALMKERFDQPGYDDSVWENVIIAHAPGGILEPMDMPSIRVVERLAPKKKIGNIYDFGANISGWVKIRGKGEKGRKITLTYDELLWTDESQFRGIAAFTYVEKSPLKQQDIYIMKGERQEEYSPDFCYHGFRYVRVENEPGDFEIEAQVVHTDLPVTGSFTCSDAMLNQIHEASRRSTLTNYFGIPTDCPHREQNGWTGDALLSSDQSLMNFDMVQAYRKWLHDFKDAQRPSGQLPGIIPSAGWGYNWGSGPAWDSALIQIPWKVWLFTGKTDLILDMWDNMCSYMEFMDSMAQEDIVAYGLGDWCQPKEQTACPVAVTDTSYYYADNCLMAKMAKITGRDGSAWVRKAEQIRNAWRSRFLHDPKLAGYQTFWACAITQELLDEKETKWAVEELVKLTVQNGFHIACGTLGVKFMFSALSENGYADVVYKMVTNPEYPSYAYWMNHGMTTLCETWDMKESCNHHMYSEVDNWFFRYIGGIRFEEEGLKIEPCLLPEIESFKAVHKEIAVERKKDVLKVNVPVDAKVIIKEKQYLVKPGYYKDQI